MKPLIFGLNQKDGICIYMYIVHIKMTLQTSSYSIDYGPTQNLNNLFYTTKNTRCQQL